MEIQIAHDLVKQFEVFCAVLVCEAIQTMWTWSSGSALIKDSHGFPQSQSYGPYTVICQLC